MTMQRISSGPGREPRDAAAGQTVREAAAPRRNSRYAKLVPFITMAAMGAGREA